MDGLEFETLIDDVAAAQKAAAKVRVSEQLYIAWLTGATGLDNYSIEDRQAMFDQVAKLAHEAAEVFVQHSE